MRALTENEIAVLKEEFIEKIDAVYESNAALGPKPSTWTRPQINGDIHLYVESELEKTALDILCPLANVILKSVEYRSVPANKTAMSGWYISSVNYRYHFVPASSQEVNRVLIDISNASKYRF
jgi:hypothetical protein